MGKFVFVGFAAAFIAGIVLAPRTPADQVSYAAKAAFLKKCLRDLGGRGSCDAPPQARLPKPQ